MGERTTYRDIAREAGVGTKTVSHALRGMGGVSHEVVERVRATAQSLDYPGSNRKLASDIALLVLRPDSFCGEFASCLQRGLPANVEGDVRTGFTYLDRSLEKDLLDDMARARVGAFILVNPLTSWQRLRRLVSERRPMIVIDGLEFPESPGLTQIKIDYGAGVRQALDHLTQLGHRQVACMVGLTTLVRNREIKAAYKEAVRQGEIFRDPNSLIEINDFDRIDDFELGYKSFKRFQEDTRNLPTALLTANDELAIGAMAAIRERKAEIPAVVSVIGFNDGQLAEYIIPRLTTVGINYVRLARICLDILEHPEEPRNPLQTFGVTLLRRNSIGPAPSR